MNYYQQLLTEITVNESAVDCSRCTIEWKCCTYRPFIANFLVGRAMQSSLLGEDVFKDWDFLLVGLSPGLNYRKLFSKKGKWGFGTDATLLCSFYNTKNGGCKIWNARPAVCRTFFCKSSYSEKGAYYWKKAEEFTWLLEWVLLEDFLYHKGWTIDDVKQMKEYLREERVGKPPKLPEELKFASFAEAQKFYIEASIYVDSLTLQQIQDLLGKEGNDKYQELLAEKLNLR